LEIIVPNIDYKSFLFADLHVRMDIDNVSYVFKNDEELMLYPKRNVTFIETDKRYYKPGEKVRMRVLILQHDLKAIVNGVVSSHFVGHVITIVNLNEIVSDKRNKSLQPIRVYSVYLEKRFD